MICDATADVEGGLAEVTIQLTVYCYIVRNVKSSGRSYIFLMNEARLSHLPFWGPSEAFFF